MTLTARTGSGAGAGLPQAASVRAAPAASSDQGETKERSMGSKQMNEADEIRTGTAKAELERLAQGRAVICGRGVAYC
jgi:hypothetical protein